jgi:DNA-binding response OmpR family regulator/signal transduction histidine kinase
VNCEATDIVVLVIEGEDTTRRAVRDALVERGFDVVSACSAEEGCALLEQKIPAVALLDTVPPGMSGNDLLEKIRTSAPDTEVVMMTSHATVELAMAAIRKGAYDFLLKPLEDPDQVVIAVDRALEKRALMLSNRVLLDELGKQERELSSAVMRLSSLVEAGRAMGEFRALPDLLDFFIALVTQELNVERASLMLLDHSTMQLHIAASRGLDHVDPARVRVKLGEGVAGSVAETGRAFLVKDAERQPFGQRPDPRLSASFISAPILLSVPIKAREKVLGVINVTNRRSGEPFDEDDLRYLTGLAGQLAVAVDRAGQFEELAKTYELLRETQEQRVCSERVTALGQMAAGAAHEVNNALSVTLARTQFITRHLDDDRIDVDRIRADVDAIKRVSLQCTDGIKQIQDFTRIRQDLPCDAIDLNDIVRDAVKMTRPRWKGRCEAEGRAVDVCFELDKIPSVAGSRRELTQVVGSLIFSAVEAMATGGALTFRTRSDSGRVRLEICDTRTGTDEVVRERPFEPLVTTQSDRQGPSTSIGYGIIARHGGTIDVSSVPGKGTVFRISLPIMDVTKVVRNMRERAPAGAVKRARILLIEDDAPVRDTYADALALHGHEVTALSSGDEVAERLAQEAFDLVVTDWSMTGISGLEVARRVKTVTPMVPVILVRGRSVQQDSAKLLDAGVDYVLAKPCLIEDLLATVQAALRPRGSGSETSPA